MKKEKVILATMCGEFGWEILRFCPFVLWTKRIKYNNNHKLIVQTRPERYDLYGEDVFEFYPLQIKGDYIKRKGDCFKLTNYSINQYNQLIKNFEDKYKDRYNIIEHVYPKIEGKMFARKDQFNWNNMCHDFKPRKDNKLLLDKYISQKDCIVLAPRFRKDFKRNWPHWGTLYNLIEKDKDLKNYTFIICGREPEYIKDSKNRFFDINTIPLDDNVSLVGLTIEAIKKSKLTVGSQSGIPNLSNLVGTMTLQWGHEKSQHENSYNVKKTKCKFIKDIKYNIDPNRILIEIKKCINEKGDK